MSAYAADISVSGQLEDNTVGPSRERNHGAETFSRWRKEYGGLRVECPANSVPVSMRQTGMVKGLEKQCQSEG
jgi:hypothetical protein